MDEPSGSLVETANSSKQIQQSNDDKGPVSTVLESSDMDEKSTGIKEVSSAPEHIDAEGDKSNDVKEVSPSAPETSNMDDESNEEEVPVSTTVSEASDQSNDVKDDLEHVPPPKPCDVDNQLNDQEVPVAPSPKPSDEDDKSTDKEVSISTPNTSPAHQQVDIEDQSNDAKEVPIPASELVDMKDQSKDAKEAPISAPALDVKDHSNDTNEVPISSPLPAPDLVNMKDQSNDTNEVPIPAPKLVAMKDQSDDTQSDDTNEVPISAPELVSMRDQSNDNEVPISSPEQVDMKDQSSDTDEVPISIPEQVTMEVQSNDTKEVPISAPEQVDMEVQSNDTKEAAISAPTPDPEQVDMEVQSSDIKEAPESNQPPEEINVNDNSNDIQEVSQSVPESVSNDMNGKSDDIKKDDKGNNEETPMEVVRDAECLPAKLVIKGFEDEDEECNIMTIQEAQDYILKKVESNIRDQNVNPILTLKNRITSLQEELKAKGEEFVKLNKVFDSLYKDHCKFLRHVGVLPKLETKTVCVGVDLPWLPETVSGFFQNDAKNKPGGMSQNNNGVIITAVKPKKESGPVECIDLTDDVDEPDPPKPTPANTTDVKNAIFNSSPVTSLASLAVSKPSVHPAPLPNPPNIGPDSIDIPPKPRLKISVDKNGIVLQWDMPPHLKKITSFEIYGYQEKSNIPVSSALWKKIGCVNPMPLPMSCTLTQFVENYKYHFSIRATSNGKFGLFSEPASIMFVPEKKRF